MRPNEPKFVADAYLSGRPFYPKNIFRLLDRQLPKCFSSDFHFLDLACGAGQSLFSFLEHYQNRSETPLQGIAVDSDPLMLEKARLTYLDRFPTITFTLANAESMPIPDASVDLILIASAVHWFHREQAFSEIERVLKPRGLLFIYEYQFPKCVEVAEVHEQTKRRFNQEWKAPRQVPRGNLSQLTGSLAIDPGWKNCGFDRPEWKETLTLDVFLGHLFSQSRYLHAESEVANVHEYRDQIRKFFAPYFAPKPLLFDLKPSSVLFQKQKTE